MEMLYVIGWTALAVTCLLIELISPGLFFFCALAASAGTLAILAALTGISCALQLWIYFPVALAWWLVCMAVYRLCSRDTLAKTNVFSLIGVVGHVVELVEPVGMMYIRVEHELWLARSNQPFELLPVGTSVRVVGVSGGHLLVRSV